MLIVGSGEEAVFRPLQGILSRLQLRKLRMTVRRGDHRSHVFAVSGLCDGDAGLRERGTRRRTHDRTGNLECPVGFGIFLQRRFCILRRVHKAGLQQGKPEDGEKQPACARMKRHCESLPKISFNCRRSFWPAVTWITWALDSNLRSASSLAYAKSSCARSK